MQPFDHVVLEERLKRCGARERVLFACLCAERLLPGYVHFKEIAGWGDATLLGSCLDLGFRCAAGSETPPQNINELVDRCDEVTPSSEEFDMPEVVHAQNCGLAVVYALEALSHGAAADAAYSAQKAYETVDSFLARRLGLRTGTLTPDVQRLIDDHELMRREIQKQHEDLERLSALTVLDEQVVETLREDNRRYVIPFED